MVRSARWGSAIVRGLVGTIVVGSTGKLEWASFTYASCSRCPYLALHFLLPPSFYSRLAPWQPCPYLVAGSSLGRVLFPIVSHSSGSFIWHQALISKNCPDK